MRKVSRCGRAPAFGLGAGALATAGVTAYLVVEIGLTHTGIGVLIGGALLSIAFVIASIKALKRANHADEAPLNKELNQEQSRLIEWLDRSMSEKPIWTEQNRGRLVQAMLTQPEHSSDLYNAVSDLFNGGEYIKGLSPREDKKIWQKYFNTMIDKPEYAVRLFERFEILMSEHDKLYPGKLSEYSDELIKRPDLATEIASIIQENARGNQGPLNTAKSYLRKKGIPEKFITACDRKFKKKPALAHVTAVKIYKDEYSAKAIQCMLDIAIRESEKDIPKSEKIGPPPKELLSLIMRLSGNPN